VFKKLWTGELFGNGFGVPSLSDYLDQSQQSGDASCGRFAADVCAAYQASVRTGTPTPALKTLMRQASPAGVIKRITAPTLLTQGEQDSLFPLSQADANARGITANGTPVKVVWRPGGHDNSAIGTGVATGQMLDWFDTVFGGSVSKQQPFQFSEQGGVLSSESGRLAQQVRQAASYPGIDGAAHDTTSVGLTGPPHEIGAPAGGTPAAITAIPGLSGLLASFGGITDVTSALSVIPSQTAGFLSPKLTSTLLIAGSSQVTLKITPNSTTDATLFVALRDLAPDGSPTLPAQLVTPIHLTGLQPGKPSTVHVQLPSIVRTVRPGHRLVLTVSTTDFAYQLPQDARSYTVALASPRLTVSTIDATVLRSGHPLAWLITGVVLALVAALGVAIEIRRRRRIVKPRPDLAEVPVSIDALVKEYSGGYRAVDDVSFRVERGQVVGLLGPNGAGKTTTLRVLVGLIRPTAGTVHVFGEPVVPGAPVLARLGAFIEGPGFLPHLSGRENLRLYWAATGRPGDEANFDTALEIAGLGGSIDRRVKSYSHGMKQRLGIAQAMLGLPELLVLDEPTNGLDPPQIAEMREVMLRYAQTGRTVVLSSHLSVADPTRAAAVLHEAGITATLVPARRALEDVFLGLIGDDE
jgi:ABC-2 type transport system ATP-binding protein